MQQKGKTRLLNNEKVCRYVFSLKLNYMCKYLASYHLKWDIKNDKLLITFKRMQGLLWSDPLFYHNPRILHLCMLRFPSLSGPREDLYFRVEQWALYEIILMLLLSSYLLPISNSTQLFTCSIQKECRYPFFNW